MGLPVTLQIQVLILLHAQDLLAQNIIYILNEHGEAFKGRHNALRSMEIIKGVGYIPVYTRLHLVCSLETLKS